MATVRPKREDDIDALYEVWQTAVSATHHFLSDEHATEIANLVRDTYLPSAELTVLVDENDVPIAFLGMNDNVVDGLFVHADHHKKGLGKVLLNLAKEDHDTLTLDVNEQNPNAVAFYQHEGFMATGRSDTDDSGRPYPYLHMRWDRKNHN